MITFSRRKLPALVIEKIRNLFWTSPRMSLALFPEILIAEVIKGRAVPPEPCKKLSWSVNSIVQPLSRISSVRLGSALASLIASIQPLVLHGTWIGPDWLPLQDVSMMMNRTRITGYVKRGRAVVFDDLGNIRILLKEWLQKWRIYDKLLALKVIIQKQNKLSIALKIGLLWEIIIIFFVYWNRRPYNLDYNQRYLIRKG